jgi:Calx-beta domain
MVGTVRGRGQSVQPAWRLGFIAIAGSLVLAGASDANAEKPRMTAPKRVTVGEGASTTIRLRLPREVKQTASVGVRTAAITAEASDFEAVEGTRVRFRKGDRKVTVRIETADDESDEPEDVFKVRYGDPKGLRIARRSTTVRIPASDDPPSLAIADRQVQEQAAVVGFTITASVPSEKPITASVSTGAGSATGGATCSVGVDYVTLSDVPVTINPGDPTDSVSVTVCEDNTGEATETANVTLTSPTNATLGDPSALLTILDED